MGHRYWLLLVAGIPACNSKVALRYHPRGSPIHHYVLTMHYGREDAAVLSTGPRHDRVWTIYYTQFERFTDPTGNGSEVGLKVDSAALQSSEDALDLSTMKGRTITAFFDGRGQLQRTERADFPGLTGDMIRRLQAMAAAAAPSFPDHPVAPGAGDAWTMTARIPLEELESDEGNFPELQVRATLDALRESANDRVAEVGINGQFAPREIRVTTSLGPLPASSSGTIIGRYSFSLPRGLMISEEWSGALTVVTNAPLVGRDTLLSRIVTQTTIRLQ